MIQATDVLGWHNSLTYRFGLRNGGKDDWFDVNDVNQRDVVLASGTQTLLAQVSLT